MPTAPRTFRWVQPQSRQQQDRAYETRRAADPALAASKRFRNSRAWQKCRDAFKAQFPLCVDPFKMHPLEYRPTEAVHHIVGLTEDITRGLDFDNLAPVCVQCHNKLEAWARLGKPTAHLFGAPQGGSASPGA